MSEWRQENKERIRDYNRRYHADNKAQAKEYNRSRYAQNRERYVEASRRWRAHNPEKLRLSRAEHREQKNERSRLYYASNKEKLAEKGRRWRVENREKARVRVRRRRAIKHSAVGSHTVADIQRQYKAQRGKCYYCSAKVGDKYHADHVIPLSRGGSDGPENIVIACPHCNHSKSDKMPHEWDGSNRLL